VGELIGQVGILPTTAGGALLLLAILYALGIMPTPGEMRRTREDRDHYRGATEKLTDAVLNQGKALDKLLSYAETTNHALALISDAVVRREKESR
jgi:hypothetical protein